ncbi:unnamed protein product, partial [Rotaria sp. Silwood1]
GLARATNGRFVFIPPNSNVDVHIGKQLQKALQSCITNIQVEWKLGTTVMTAPTNIPPVYVNDRLIVYALANDPMFVFNDKSSVELRNDQIRLGQILSPHTAFIGVEKRMNGSNADMVLREVPIQISADDQHLQEPFYEVWPIDDENIVRYLINKQKFDGLWDLDANDIELLTGKPLTSFTPFNNKQILISAIIIVVLETRFATMSIMWHGTVQKARKHLFDLLGKDAKELELLLENIRQQF